MPAPPVYKQNFTDLLLAETQGLVCNHAGQAFKDILCCPPLGSCQARQGGGFTTLKRVQIACI